MEIKGIENYLARFTVYKSNTLLPADWEIYRQGKCPYCARKLYWTKDLSKELCKSKKCPYKLGTKKNFMVTRNTASRLGII